MPSSTTTATKMASTSSASGPRPTSEPAAASQTTAKRTIGAVSPGTDLVALLRRCDHRALVVAVERQREGVLRIADRHVDVIAVGLAHPFVEGSAGVRRSYVPGKVPTNALLAHIDVRRGRLGGRRLRRGCPPAGIDAGVVPAADAYVVER